MLLLQFLLYILLRHNYPNDLDEEFVLWQFHFMVLPKVLKHIVFGSNVKNYHSAITYGIVVCIFYYGCSKACNLITIGIIVIS
jgi:hypothetical protein